MESSTTNTRPRRRPARREHRLVPASDASWQDLVPPGADEATRSVFACLEAGVLEAWQDTRGLIRLYESESGRRVASDCRTGAGSHPSGIDAGRVPAPIPHTARHFPDSSQICEASS